MIVPCYNEETRLPAADFLLFAQGQDKVDVLLVNDGSRDQTKKVIEDLAAQHPRLRAHSLAENSGKAEAVRQGIQLALQDSQYDLVGYWDADLSTPLSESIRMLNHFQARPDLLMIYGSRMLKLGNRVKRLWIRHILGRIFATLVSNMIQIPVYDTQCGAKLIRAGTARIVFREVFLSRWFFDVEILWRYLIEGWPLDHVYELPVSEWVHKAGSKLKLKDYFMTFSELAKIRFHYSRLKKAKARGPN